MNKDLEILYSEKGIKIIYEPRTDLYWLSINIANFAFQRGFLDDYNGLDESELVGMLDRTHPLISSFLNGENIPIIKKGIEQARLEEERRFEEWKKSVREYPL